MQHLDILKVVMLVLLATLTPASLSQPLAAGRAKFLGNVVGNGFAIRSDFVQYWNQVTAENAGKWGSVEGSPGSYNWTGLDNIYNFAISHQFPYKHHTLIWGQQQPGFMASLDSASQYQEIVNWINQTGQRYPSASFCDVVNEPLHAVPVYANALGGSGATGWDWVIKAFELARLYWIKGVKLLINEYSVINDGSANAQYLQIINLLKDRGLIDGIGVQAHYFEVDGGASLNTLRTNLNNLAATGLPIYLSEFDINQQVDSIQLQRYQTIFPVLWEHPGVKGITLWGYSQNETWRPYTYLITSGAAERPALQWLARYVAIPLPPVLVSPSGTTGEPRNPFLRWRPAIAATSYRVQVSTASTFSSVVVDSVIADTVSQLTPLASNSTFYWRVSAQNDSGASSYSVTANFATGDQVVAVEEIAGLPMEVTLSQNYPNPFNPSTWIEYTIGGDRHQGPQASVVRLGVYDVLGREVARLVNETASPGVYRAQFDGSNLSSGVYFYRLDVQAAGGAPVARTRMLVLMK